MACATASPLLCAHSPGRGVLVGGGAAGPGARRLRRPVPALPRLRRGVRVRHRHPDAGLRRLRLRPAAGAAHRRRAERPRRAPAGARGGAGGGGGRDGPVRPGRRGGLAARRPRGAGPGHRGDDRRVRRGAAGPAAPGQAARPADQLRLPRPRALARRARGLRRRPAAGQPRRVGVRRLTVVFVVAGRSPGSRCRSPRRGCRRPGVAAAQRARAAQQPAGLPRRAALPGRDLGAGRAVRLAGPVAGRRCVRGGEPRRRRVAHPGAQRHRPGRVAGHPGLARRRGW